jgi:membrane-associated PAP2 superfamily phosphatase
MFSFRSFWIATLLTLALLGVWEWSALDLPVSRFFGNAQGFVWRDHWLTTEVFHKAGRNAGWVCLALIAMNIWRRAPIAPFSWFHAIPKSERLWLVLTTLGCAGMVVVLKYFSHSSCPWDFAEFGGPAAKWVSHWQLKVYDGGPGHCFPSGHASTGFSFLAAWFVLAPQSRRRAWVWIMLVCLFGAVFGLAQLARGAHFVSHTLWTAYFCWLFSALSAALFFPRRVLSRTQ